MKGTPAACGGHAVDPGVAHHEGLGCADSAPRRGSAMRFGDHAPAVGIRLELAHVVAGDGDVEERVESKAREGLQRDVACVVRPERGLEAGLAGPAHGLQRARLEGGRRPPRSTRGRARWTIDSPPGRAPPAGRVRSAHRRGSGPGETAGAATALQVGAHVESHGREVEGRADERVVEVEDTDARLDGSIPADPECPTVR